MAFSDKESDSLPPNGMRDPTGKGDNGSNKGGSKRLLKR